MAVSMIGPKFYAWDRNGKPLAGGQLYTYQARTNTPKATYQSEDQEVENTNPVILNGEGYANVYLDGSYKMVLKDANGSEIWSSDPVTSAQANEWTNCFAATYTGPSAFKVAGNQTDIYLEGRKLRINNNASEYEYSTVESSVYAGGETSVVVADAVITTGLNSVCVSIIGQFSHNETYQRNNFDAHDASAISKFTEFSLSEQAALIKVGIDVTIKVPSDFQDLREAVEFAIGSSNSSDKYIEILIESGHKVANGVIVSGANAGNIFIRSEDEIVYLADGFVGCDLSRVPASLRGGVENPVLLPLFCVTMGGHLPIIDAVFDMNNAYGTGLMIAEGYAIALAGKGVINAGERGVLVHGRANLYGANFSGSNGSALRLQQSSSVCARDFNGDNSCKTLDLTNSAIYVSRGSICEFRGGTARNSGAWAMIARRSIISAADCDLSDAAIGGAFAESQGANIDLANATIRRVGVGAAVQAASGGKIYAGGVDMSRPSAPQATININAGEITVNSGTAIYDTADSNPITGEISIITSSNAPYLNAICFRGVIYYTDGNGSFDVGENSNGVWERKSNGLQTTFSTNVVFDTGVLTPGDLSPAITLPDLPNTFNEIYSVIIKAVGRTSAGGGGNRVAVTPFDRLAGTGNEFKVRNEGLQLDGPSTILNIASVEYQVTIFGSWR